MQPSRWGESWHHHCSAGKCVEVEVDHESVNYPAVMMMMMMLFQLCEEALHDKFTRYKIIHSFIHSFIHSSLQS